MNTQETPQTPEIIKTSKRRVCCNGGGGALGHPAIYLDMGEKSEVVCPYCSRTFVFDASAS